MAAILKEDPPDFGDQPEHQPGPRAARGHCLEKNPERRFQSARDLAYDLEALSAVSGGAAPAGRPRRSALARAARGASSESGSAFSPAGPSRDPKKPRLLPTGASPSGAGRFSVAVRPRRPDRRLPAAWEGQPARIFGTRAGGVESRSLQLPDARVLAVSRERGARDLHPPRTAWTTTGTLARVPLEGGAPRSCSRTSRSRTGRPTGASSRSCTPWAEGNASSSPSGRSSSRARRRSGRCASPLGGIGSRSPWASRLRRSSSWISPEERRPFRKDGRRRGRWARQRRLAIGRE